jgi:GDPmannose 4,6-dehydratase
VELLLGDAAKAKAKLGWTATCSLEDLVKDMMRSDLALAERDAHMKKSGFKVDGSRK